MNLPKSNEAYRSREYWDERFATEESYEWLASYHDVRELVRSYVHPAARVLTVGHGNSRLGVDLVEDGYANVTNSDFSPIVIDQMRSRYPTHHWAVANMLSLSASFANSSFDCIIDKAAMDALVTDVGDPWNPCDRAKSDIRKVCTEMRRVLRPAGGRLIQISFQQPHFRERLMTSDMILETVCDVDVGLGYFFYVWTML